MRYDSPYFFTKIKTKKEGREADGCLGLVLFNHYVWFSYFSDPALSVPRSRYDLTNMPTFTEIASFFGLCVWLVPFSLFVSLSASDNVLPTMGSEEPGGVDGKNRRQGMVKVVVDMIRDGIGELGRMAGWNRPDAGF